MTRPARVRRYNRPARSRPLPAVGELVTTIWRETPGWKPVHRADRATTPAWCTRCDRPCRLPFGPGQDLCQACRDGETADHAGMRPVSAHDHAAELDADSDPIGSAAGLGDHPGLIGGGE